MALAIMAKKRVDTRKNRKRERTIDNGFVRGGFRRRRRPPARQRPSAAEAERGGGLRVPGDARAAEAKRVAAAEAERKANAERVAEAARAAAARAAEAARVAEAARAAEALLCRAAEDLRGRGLGPGEILQWGVLCLGLSVAEADKLVSRCTPSSARST